MGTAVAREFDLGCSGGAKLEGKKWFVSHSFST